MKAIHVKKQTHCRCCNNELSIFAENKEGDYTVCIYCKCIGKIDNEFCLTPVNKEQLKELKKLDKEKYYRLIKVGLMII